jgi:DNA (cytosine-5)-methyltransferase 1
MRYLSVCSGIEAATVAWHPLGWTPVAFSEIEPFPSAVLAHHYPSVPNLGDMTKHKSWPLDVGSIDLLVGGTPCQSFSVAGLRKGLSDPRGGLMLTYLEIARRLRPRWVVWENVPGVLSSNGGRDFGSFLGALGELGYGWAYRVLDAQWVRTQRHPRAVPQRRRRVFVVGCLGDGAAAAAVLVEHESVQRDSQKGRAKSKGAPADASDGAGAGCYWNGEQWAAALTRKGCDDRMPDKQRLFAVLQPIVIDRMEDVAIGTDMYNHAITGDVAATMGTPGSSAGASGPTVMQAVGFSCKDHGADAGTVAPTMRAMPHDGSHANGGGQIAVAHGFYSTGGTHGVNQHPEVSPAVKVGSGLGIPSPPAVAHALRGEGFDASEDGTGRVTPIVPVSHSLTMNCRAAQEDGTGRGSPLVLHAMTVRRLTPRECERLQAFPDDYTLIPWRKKPADQCPDGPRYKALGNSMAVNCMEWIGERIAAYEARGA